MKRLMRTSILNFVYTYGAAGAKAAAQKTARRPGQAPRVLLMRPDHLGDMIMTTPILAAIRTYAPDAQITMMVGPWSSEVVERHPALDHLQTCPFPGFQRATQSPLDPYKLLFNTAHQLQQEEYDLAINLRPDFWWGAALLYLAQIPQRIGYALEPGAQFLTEAIPFHEPEHSTVSSLRLASVALHALGYPQLEEPFTPARYPLQFTPKTEEQVWIGERLKQSGIASRDPLVVIHPGTGGDVKLWRTEGWAHVANDLMTNKILPQPAKIALTGSPNERSLLEAIAQGMNTPPMLLTDMTIGQLAALLKRAQLVLGVDNGPLHIAAAQNTLSLRIYGPTDARMFGPWGNPERHIVITSNQKCADCPLIPCGRLDFSPEELPAHPCVKIITEEQVKWAIMRLVGTAPSTI